MFTGTSAKKEERKKLPVWYRALSAVLTALAVIAVCFCVVLAFISSSGEKGGGLLGNIVLKVTSASMEPTFSPGDVLLYSAYDGEELAVGDIVVFRAPSGVYEGSLVTHRISSVSEEDGEAVYRTKGDAAPSEDAWVLRAEDIVGVYSRELPLAADVSRHMQSAGGRMLVIGLPVILLAAVLIADAVLSRKLAKQKSAPSDKEPNFD